MKIKVLYITSSSYSGSTILGFLLGTSESIFNCGELPHFFEKDYNEYCSCGKTFQDCIFWGRIREKCQNIINESNSREYYLFKSIYDEASKTGTIEYILDVSKDLTRLEKLSKISELDLYIVYLVRDLRGIINSNKKHKNDCRFFTSICNYFRTQKAIESFLSKSGDNFIRINYEDLCTNTRKVIGLVNDFLGIKIKENYEDMIGNTTQHVFAGNVAARNNLRKGIYHDNSFERLNKFEKFLGTVLWMLYRVIIICKSLKKLVGFLGSVFWSLYRTAKSWISFFKNSKNE